MELTSNNQAADKYEIKLIAAPLNCKLVYSTLCVALEKFAEKFKIILRCISFTIPHGMFAPRYK